MEHGKKNLRTYRDRNKKILLFSFTVFEDQGHLEHGYLAFDKKLPSWGLRISLQFRQRLQLCMWRFQSLGIRGGWTPPDRRDMYVGYFHLTCICPSPNIRRNWVIHIWEFQRSLILLSFPSPLSLPLPGWGSYSWACPGKVQVTPR